MRPAIRRSTLIVLAAILVAACASFVSPLRQVILRSVGHLLLAEDPLEKADVAVIPTWAGLSGVLEAASLVRAGVTGRVAIIAGPNEPAEIEMVRAGIAYEDDADRYRRLLRSLGALEVERVDERAVGTESEAGLLADWCDRRGFVAVIVVSTADHSRRLRRMLHRSFNGHRTRPLVRIAAHGSFDPDRWWSSRDGLRIGVFELEKLVVDVIRHPWQ